MDFLITRTSARDDSQPHEKATRKKLKYKDERHVGNPEEFNSRCFPRKENWFDSGTNHRIESGHIVRDIEREEWVISLDGVAGLIDFCKEEGELIISVDEDYCPPIMGIEIYDDYRE